MTSKTDDDDFPYLITPSEAEIVELTSGDDLIAVATRAYVALDELDLSEEQRAEVQRAKRLTEGHDPVAVATRALVVLDEIDEIELDEDQSDEVWRRRVRVRHLRHDCPGCPDCDAA